MSHPTKISSFAFAIALCLFLSLSARAQVTNLHMNRGDTTFAMTSGDTLRWEYDIPAGSSVAGELWYDVNGNGAINPASDVRLATFSQQDGDAVGSGGYPDLDGTQNGHVVFYERAGLPAGNYVLHFIQNSVATNGTGTVAALASPAHTISGVVTPPAGKSAKFILVQVERAAGYGQIFWSALTDVAGAYSIAMNADTVGNPWRLRISHNPYQLSFVYPAETLVTISGNPTNYDFLILDAVAVVRGYLTDDVGFPFKNTTVHLNRLTSISDTVTATGLTDTTGLFEIPIRPGTLNGSSWKISQVRSGPAPTTYMLAIGKINSISQGDTLYYNLIAFLANSTISGQVLIDGVVPDPPILVYATSANVAEAYGRTNIETGEFLIPVTDKFTSYTVHVDPVIAQLYHVPDTVAAPGDNSIFIYVFTTGIKEGEFGMPEQFVLEQNYPNPFNPMTAIEFKVPVRSTGGSELVPISLRILDVQGREVATIVNESLQPGQYKRNWDAFGVPSGVYFSQLSAGTARITKKMILMR